MDKNLINLNKFLEVKYLWIKEKIEIKNNYYVYLELVKAPPKHLNNVRNNYIIIFQVSYFFIEYNYKKN